MVASRHGADVVAGQQRRGHQRPQAHVGAVLVVGHVAVADLQHVGVVPVARAGVGRSRNLLLDIADHALPRVADVAGGAPQIAAHLRSPLLHAAHAVLAEAVDDGASRRLQRVAHLLVDRLQLVVLVDVARAAPVVLQDSRCPRPRTSWRPAPRAHSWRDSPRRCAAPVRNRCPASAPWSEHNRPAPSCQGICGSRAGCPARRARLPKCRRCSRRCSPHRAFRW